VTGKAPCKSTVFRKREPKPTGDNFKKAVTERKRGFSKKRKGEAINQEPPKGKTGMRGLGAL